MKNDLIYLVTTIRTQTKSGFYEEKHIRRELFAELKSVTRSEHYAAERAGESVEMIAVVNDSDYQEAILVEGEDISERYEAETIYLDGSRDRETVTPVIKKVPEYVEFDNVLYKIKRNFKKPDSTDRELTLSREA